MPYTFRNSKGDLYFLHRTTAGRNNDGELLYFAKSQNQNTIDELPDGYRVVESDRTGMPVVKKKRETDLQ